MAQRLRSAFTRRSSGTIATWLGSLALPPFPLSPLMFMDALHRERFDDVSAGPVAWIDVNPDGDDGRQPDAKPPAFHGDASAWEHVPPHTIGRVVDDPAAYILRIDAARARLDGAAIELAGGGAFESYHGEVLSVSQVGSVCQCAWVRERMVRK